MGAVGLRESTAELFQRSGRSLRLRYGLALSAVALLVVIGWGVLHRLVARHDTVNAHVVQIVGRQRMLSQRLCKAALALLSRNASPSREAHRAEMAYRAEMARALDEWQGSHEALLKSELVQAARGDDHAPLREHLEALEPEFRAMARAAEELLALPSSETASGLLGSTVAELLLHERPYLVAMDHITEDFASESSARDRKARGVGLMLGLALLLTLALEAAFVFRPALAQLERAVRKSGQAWEQVYRREHELSTMLSALPDLILRYTAEGEYLGAYASNSDAAAAPLRHLEGRSVRDMVPPAQAAECIACFQRALANGGVERFECALPLAGSERHIEMRISALHPGAVVVLMRDVTAERRIERRILEAVDHEQQRIGRELHDGVCQSLSGLALMMQSSIQRVTQGGAVSASQLATFARFIEQSVADVRQIARGLMPIDLDALGLEFGLHRMVEDLATLHGARYACDVSLDGYEPPLDVSLQIYRISQEAVSNALRHGRPRHLVVTLAIETSDAADASDAGDAGAPRKRELLLTIRDDGVGMPPSARAANGATAFIGMGLRTMAYRAQCIGAWLRIESDPLGGTAVRCCLPLPEEPEEEKEAGEESTPGSCAAGSLAALALPQARSIFAGRQAFEGSVRP